MQLEHVEPWRPPVIDPEGRDRPEEGDPSMDDETTADADELLASLRRHLDDYAETLSSRERAMLRVILRRATTPAQRIQADGGDGLLTPEEQRLLDELDAGGSAGG